MDEKPETIQVYGDVCIRTKRKERRKRQKLLIIELFLDYAKNSTLHGLRYIAERGLSAIEKLFWLITFVSSFVICVMMIRDVWIKWQTSPVLVHISEEVISVAKVPFPSVTICPQIKIIPERLNYTDIYRRATNREENTTYEELTAFLDVSVVCGPMSEYLANDLAKQNGANYTFTDSSLVDNLLMAAPNISEVFNFCQWRGLTVECSDIFVAALTSEGVCYNFNALAAKEMFRRHVQTDYTLLNSTTRTRNWTLSQGYKNSDEDPYPRRGRENGASPDLEILLHEKNSSSSFCNSLNSGYKIYVQHPADMPQSSHYYYAALPSQVSSIALKFSMLNTSESLKGYKPEVRGCYFPEDVSLRYFKVYTPNNCRLECLSLRTLKKCKCVWFNMPHDQGTKICTFKEIECVKNVQNELTNMELKADLGDKNVDACLCLPSCYSVQYDAEILKTAFDVRNYFAQLEQIFHYSVKSDDHEYSRIEMYFKEPRFISMRRSELFGFVDFLANCGGLLGLFLGFSFLSLAELGYFVSLRLCCTLRRDLKEEKANKQAAKDNLDNLERSSSKNY